MSDLVIGPALDLLEHARFPAARREFERALRLWRTGEQEACLTSAVAAVESVGIVVLAENGVTLPKATWGPIRNALFQHGLLDVRLKESLGNLQVPQLRHTASHGQGTEVVEFDKEVIAFAIHQAAALILFLASLKRKP